MLAPLTPDLARNSEHVLNEPGYLSACGAHRGAIEALKEMREGGMDVRLFVSGHMGRYEVGRSLFGALLRVPPGVFYFWFLVLNLAKY